MEETAGKGGSNEAIAAAMFHHIDREEEEEDHMVVVRRRMKRNKFMKKVNLTHITKKVKILYGFLWFSVFVFVFPILSWMWTAVTFFQHPDTFAVLIMKYAWSVVCVFELSFLITLIVLGILRLFTIKRKKNIRRIRLTADITTGIFVAHLLVYIPMSAFVVTRFKSRIYDEMKLTVQTKREFEKKDDVWRTTQRFYNCCGLEGPKDWAWQGNRTVTLSCCKDEKNCTMETAFTSGCYEPQRAMLHLYFLIVGLPTLAFQIILTILTFYGFNSYRINSKKMRMLTASEKAKRRSEEDLRLRNKDDSDILFVVDSEPDIEEAHGGSSHSKHAHGESAHNNAHGESTHAKNAHGENAHTKNAHGSGHAKEAHRRDSHDEPPHTGPHYYL